MMLDMMPSEPLPAITFSTFTSYSRASMTQVQAAVGIKVETGIGLVQGIERQGRGS
jgi:hypothetical protein